MTSCLAQAGLRTDALAEPTGNSAEAGFAMDTVQPTTANIAALKNAIGLTVQSRGSDLGLLHAQRRMALVQAMPPCSIAPARAPGIWPKLPPSPAATLPAKPAKATYWCRPKAYTKSVNCP